VSVSGDAAFLRLASPLSGVSAAPIGDGDSFTIAGYGTMDERERGAFGSLHEASLVAASARALVDPGRTGSIGASACFGDSGGARRHAGRHYYPRRPPVSAHRLRRFDALGADYRIGQRTSRRR
jgi:hypothetical protein